MGKLSKVALFVGGTVFGSVGFKVLASDEAKKVYVKAMAMGLRAKDKAMEKLTVVQENAADVLAEAKELNEERALEKADETTFTIIEDDVDEEENGEEDATEEAQAEDETEAE